MSFPVRHYILRQSPRLFGWSMSQPGNSRTLLIVHGAGEHSGRYLDVATSFCRAGWDVFACDLRGHGCSEGERVHVDRFEEYLDDFDRILRHFQLSHYQPEILAHSFGGLVTLRACQEGYLAPKRLTLTAPLLKLRAPVSRWKLRMGRIARFYHPTMRFRSTVKPTDLLLDQSRLQERMKDPLIHRSITANWYFEMREALSSAWKTPLTIPCRIEQGTEDRVVAPDAATRWALRPDVENCDLRFHPGAMHELLQDASGLTLTEELVHLYSRKIAKRKPVNRMKEFSSKHAA